MLSNALHNQAEGNEIVSAKPVMKCAYGSLEMLDAGAFGRDPRPSPGGPPG
jgi:hypothetical protein